MTEDNQLDLIVRYYEDEATEAEINQFMYLMDTDEDFAVLVRRYTAIDAIVEKLDKIENPLQSAESYTLSPKEKQFFADLFAGKFEEEPESARLQVSYRNPTPKTRTWVIAASVVLTALLGWWWMNNPTKPHENSIVKEEKPKPEVKKDTTQIPPSGVRGLKTPKQEPKIILPKPTLTFWDENVKAHEGLIVKQLTRGNEEQKTQVESPKNRRICTQSVRFAWSTSPKPQAYRLRVINPKKLMVLDTMLQTSDFVWQIPAHIPPNRYYWQLSVEQEEEEKTLFAGEFFILKKK
jgi:hypothetical protein